MAMAKLYGVVHELCALAGREEFRSDRQLLADFAARQDETAFAVLVRRHGPMVFGVCKRMLRRIEDAEDAFQATFLVLVRKARVLGHREILGNWLYGVAYHTALKARATAAARSAREARMPAPETSTADRDLEALMVLDQELNRLPDRHRVPLVLCDLEGKTYKEAARHLGCPEGTVASRLARARALLAQRVKSRGVTLTAAALTVAVPASLTAATLLSAEGAAGPRVLALADAMLKTLLLSKIKTAGIMLLCVVLVGAALPWGFIQGATAKSMSEGPVPTAANRSGETAPASLPALLGEQALGTLKGRIVWGGQALPNSKEMKLDRGAEVVSTNLLFDRDRQTLRDDALVIHPSTRGIKNVYVYLLAGPVPLSVHLGQQKPARDHVTIDVTNGTLEPRVVAVRAGQTVVFTNNSPYQHVIRWQGDGINNQSGSINFPPHRTFELKGLRPQKVPVQLTSSLHGWMKGQIGVFEHPYFALTDAAGNFEIHDVPAGQHRVMIYHEQLGVRHGAANQPTETITNPAGQALDLGELAMGS
jgi:RNA polymerase sigma factor (sigma-70 family)